MMMFLRGGRSTAGARHFAIWLKRRQRRAQIRAIESVPLDAVTAMEQRAAKRRKMMAQLELCGLDEETARR